MDVVTAILACSLYYDDALVRAIAETNSRGNRYSVIDATLPPSDEEARPQPRTLDAAISLVKTIASMQGEPLFGLMQIPPGWASVYGRQANDLFDPCTNVAIGTARLSEFAYQCKRKDHATPQSGIVDRRNRVDKSGPNRGCVIHKYAQAIHMPEFELVIHLELEHQRADDARFATPSASAIFWQDAMLNGHDGRDPPVFSTGATDSVLVDPFATSDSSHSEGREQRACRRPTG